MTGLIGSSVNFTWSFSGDKMVSCSFHFSFGIGLRKKLFLAETGWHRYRKEIFFLINKMNSFEFPKREMPYKKNGCVRRTFWG